MILIPSNPKNQQPPISYEILSTDILVVGGGGAAVYAAHAAAQKTAKVLIVSKGKIGRSGNTIMVGGSIGMDGQSAYAYGEKTANPSFTKGVAYEEIIKQSFYLADQNIVHQFCEYAPECVKDLVDRGRTINAQFDFFPPAGYTCNGPELGRTLRLFLKNQPNIEMKEDIRIVDLLKQGKHVVGAIGIDIFSGVYYVIEAKATILATGGYQPFSLKCTEASASNGDGIAMAYRAGATLRDMEFLLFIPGTIVSPPHHRGSIFGYIYSVVSDQYELTDKHRHAIQIPENLRKIYETSEMNKLIMNFFGGKIISQGLGTPNGGIYIDFQKQSPEELKESFDLIQTYFKSPTKSSDPENYYYSGENFSDLRQVALQGGKWEVNVSAEYSMGGVWIDEAMRTSIPGLYAAGEVSSGCFGAMRIADGLTEMLVQGRKAGETALSELALNPPVDFSSEDLQTQIHRSLRKYDNLLHSTQGLSPLQLRNQIQQIADSGFGSFRNQDSMIKALQKLQQLSESVKSRGFGLTTHNRKYNWEWDEAISVLNLQLCLEAGLRAALMRTESRGTHIRQDFPQVDLQNWTVNILLENHAGKMVLRKVPPKLIHFFPPRQNHPDIMSYVKEIESEFGNIDV